MTNFISKKIEEFEKKYPGNPYEELITKEQAKRFFVLALKDSFQAGKEEVMKNLKDKGYKDFYLLGLEDGQKEILGNSKGEAWRRGYQMGREEVRKEILEKIEKLKKDEYKSAAENNLPSLDVVRMYNQALSNLEQEIK